MTRLWKFLWPRVAESSTIMYELQMLVWILKKALGYHALVLGAVACKTPIERKPSAPPSTHVTWFRFFIFLPCSLACSWFFATFVSLLRQLVKASLMQPCHLGVGPQLYRLSWIAAWNRSSCHMAMFCMNQNCQWCMHCSALAAIWTGLNLTSCWTMSKFMEWWYALRAATGQSLHIVLIDSTRVHKLGDGRLKLGPGCVMKNRCWGLNDTQLQQPRPKI